MPREAADVHLVDQCAVEGRPRRNVPFPVVRRRRGDDAPHGHRAVVPRARRRLAVVAGRHGDGQAVRVEEHLLRVEPQAALRGERPVRAVAVDLPRPEAGHEHVPVVVRAVRAGVQPDHARGRRRAGIVEEQQLDRGGSLREDAEVDAVRRQRSRRAVRCCRSPGRDGSSFGSVASAERDRLDVPDVAAVLADGAIGREAADARAVQDGHARPARAGPDTPRSPAAGSPRRPGSRRTADTRRARAATPPAAGTARGRRSRTRPPSMRSIASCSSGLVS